MLYIAHFSTLVPTIKKKPYMRKGMFNITSNWKGVCVHRGYGMAAEVPGGSSELKMHYEG